MKIDNFVCKRPESELIFSENLQKVNAHAKRKPYRILSSKLASPLHVRPYAFDSALRIYPKGLEVGTVRGEYARYTNWSKFVYLIMFVFAALFICGFFAVLFSGDIIYSLIPLFGAYFTFCGGMMHRRGVLHQPIDDPVLFDRENKVVYVRPYEMGGFFDFWKEGAHGPSVAYRWDDQVHARVYNFMHYRGGGVVSEGFELALLCVRQDTSNEVEKLISIGTQANGSDVDQLALWEHIRQYMEEGGPPLQPGDKLRATDLSRVSEFPPEIITRVGGPPLDAESIKRQIQKAVAR